MEMQEILENRIHKLNHFKDMDVNFLIIPGEVLVETMENQLNKGFIKMAEVQLIG